MLRRLLSVLWYTGATLVVVAALGFSLARLALPMLESRAGQLEALVKDTVGQDVQLGHLEMSWRGLGPELQVHEVVVRDQGTDQILLVARELRIDFSLWRSLWAWQPVPSRLVLLGSELSLYRDKDGQLAIEGIRQQSQHLNPWLLVFGQRHVELRDIRVHWHDALGQFPDLILNDIDLRMRNRGDRHQVDVDMQLPAEFGTRLRVMTDLIGTTAQPKDWSGELYVALEQAPLTRWLAAYLPKDWRLAAYLSGALWLDLQDGELQQIQGNLDFVEPRITHGTAAAEQVFAAQRLTTQLDWRQIASARNWSGPGSTKWILNLDQLQVTDAYGVWPQSGVSLAVATGQDAQQQIQIGVDYLRIEALVPLLAQLWSGAAEQAELLKALRPQGELRALQLAFVRQHDQLSEFRYQTRFSELSNTAVEKLPGVSALHGKLAGSPQRGVLELDSHAAHLVFPKLFREPLQLDTLSGRFDWQRLANRLRIESNEVVAVNEDIATRSRLRLDIPNDGGKPLLELQSSFADGRVQSTYKYLPVGIMPAHTVAWLDRALVSGRVRAGSALYQGRVGDFPFDQATGRLEVRATIIDTVLDYKEGWHRIEGLEAELGFINRSMQIQGVAGKILGSDVRNVDVRIEDLAHARLTIKGDASGSLADMLRFVQESPLGTGSAGGLGALQASGNAHLDLDLTLPLAEHKPAQVDGRVQLSDNGLSLPEWDIALEKLQGELQFTQEAVTGQGIRATLLGAPVKLSVEASSLDGYAMTRVRASGPLPLVEQISKLGVEVNEHLTGNSDWQAAIYIPKQVDGAKPAVELTSDLRGIDIDLPQPFNKPAGLARTFTVRADIKPHALGPFLLRYGEHSAAFELERNATGQKLTRAEIKFSALDAQLPKDSGVQVRGSLPLFQWDEWRGLLSGGAAAGDLNQVDVTLEESTAFGRRFQPLHIQAQRNPEGWLAQLEGPDLQGSGEIPALREAPLRFRFARLTIPPLATETPQSALQPADLPALDLAVQQLQFHELDLGQVALTTHPIATGMAVDRLEVNAEWMQFTAAGEWTQQAHRDASRFRIEMQGGDLGKMLAAFGYAGSVEGGKTKGEIDANWPGTPTDFSLANLEGSLKAEVGQGRLLNVEAGAGRVFGLLSLQGLRRRLSLDFSDVFEKGFGFDQIQGKFSLLDGDAYTNDLVIEGPAARIEISGRTGLAKQDYDQLVTVIPHVQSTLPLAGAIAGGPVLGAALLLADKLFEQQLDGLGRLVRHQYSVTGSWEDPQFQKLPREPARPLQKN